MNIPLEEKVAQLSVENEKLKKMAICRRCGFDNTKSEYKVDDEVIKEYYKCMLTQERYTKEYELMNGTYVVSCQEPDRRLLAAYANCWDRLDSTVVQYAHDLMCVLFITSIERRTEEGMVKTFELSYEDKLNIFRSASFDNIESVIPETYQEMPQILLSAIKGVVNAFSTLCTQVSEAALDENFWKGVGLN